MKAQDALSALLAFLRAQGMLYQASHWQSKGPTFYENHLLFERLYGSVQEQIDSLAEKLVGIYGDAPVDPIFQAGMILKVTQFWAQAKNPFQQGLASEQTIQQYLKVASKALEDEGALTMGLDDWLCATANAHESNAYLLSRNMLPIEKAAAYQAAPDAAHHFYDTPRRRETREFAQSKAPTNHAEVGKNVARIHGNDEVEDLVEGTPPTPSEIIDQPGGDSISTLSRLVVKSEDPAIHPAEVANRDLFESPSKVAAFRKAASRVQRS